MRIFATVLLILVCAGGCGCANRHLVREESYRCSESESDTYTCDELDTVYLLDSSTMQTCAHIYEATIDGTWYVDIRDDYEHEQHFYSEDDAESWARNECKI